MSDNHRGSEHPIIEYHIKRHSFARFKEIVDELVDLHGAQILNRVGDHRFSSLWACLHKSPPDIARFKYLIEKGAAVDIFDPSYQDAYYRPLTENNQWKLIERWSLVAKDSPESNEMLLAILEAGESLDNKNESPYVPLLFAANDYQRNLLFRYGATPEAAEPMVIQDPTKRPNFVKAQMAYRSYLANAALMRADEENLLTAESHKRSPKL